MICMGCVLDHLQEYRIGRKTASKQWKDGWYFSRTYIEVESSNGRIVEFYPWEYSAPGLDAAIQTAELLNGTALLRVLVHNERDGEMVDKGFALQVWPRFVFRCGDEEVVLEEMHDHDEN